MHRDGGIAEHRLRPCGRDHQSLVRFVSERVTDVPKAAIHIFMNHFDIGKSRFAPWAPVDQALGTIEELVLPKHDEGFAHGARQTFIHRKALVIPIAGYSQRFELVQDRIAGFFLPAPDLFNESLAPHRRSAQTALGKLPFDDILRGNSGMVRARNP